MLLRGNHDAFWPANQTARLNERYAGRLAFLQGNYYPYRDYALVGTKGFCYEGPYYLNAYRQVIGWDEEKAEHAKRIVARELDRLRESFEAAKADGAHLHGQSKFRLSVLGEMNGVGYSLAAGDYLRWKPLKIMD